jgi:hypothetical protein
VGVHKRRLADTSADCRGTACRAPTPCLPTGPWARAAWLFAAGDGPPARCQRHNTTGAGLGPAPTRTSTIHHSRFAIRHFPALWRRRHGRSSAAPLRVRRVAAGRVWDPPLPGPAPLATRYSLLATRHSPLAARCSPLAVFPHSPFAIRHSPSFPARRLPPLFTCPALDLGARCKRSRGARGRRVGGHKTRAFRPSGGVGSTSDGRGALVVPAAGPRRFCAPGRT